MRRIGSAFLVAGLLAGGSSGAQGAVAVLDKAPSFQLAAEAGWLGPDDRQAGVVLAGGPPRWAPAHGFRRKPGKAKDGGVHVHHHDHSQPDEPVRVALPGIGIERGFCDRELIGGILGGVAGGALGSQVGDGGTRTVATIGGTIVGVLVGGTIGRHMDEADHACVTHALAYGETHQVVAWDGRRGERFHVVPLAASYHDMRGRTCRDFQTIAIVDGVRRSERMTACRQSNGSWQQAS